MEETADGLRVHDHLKGQLKECKQRITIYRDPLADNNDIRTRWAIINAIESMRGEGSINGVQANDLMYCSEII